MARFCIGLVLVIVVSMGGVLLEGGNLLYYLGLTAFMIVALVPLAAALSIWKISALLASYRDAFAEKASDPARSARVFSFLETASYLSGVIVTILGTVLILSNLGDMQRLGTQVSAGILGILYSAFFGLVNRILRTRVEERK